MGYYLLCLKNYRDLTIKGMEYDVIDTFDDKSMAIYLKGNRLVTIPQNAIGEYFELIDYNDEDYLTM